MKALADAQKTVGASHAIVVSPGGITEAASDFARAHDMMILNAEDLVRLQAALS